MFFFACRHVAGAHSAISVSAALSHAHAALNRIGKTGFVVGKREVRLPLRRAVMFAIAEVLVSTLRPDHFPRIHLPIRVPDLLEFDERLH